MYLRSLPQRLSRDQRGGGESSDGLGLGQARGGPTPSQPAQESRSRSRPGRNLSSEQFHVDLPGPGPALLSPLEEGMQVGLQRVECWTV